MGLSINWPWVKREVLGSSTWYGAADVAEAGGMGSGLLEAIVGWIAQKASDHVPYVVNEDGEALGHPYDALLAEPEPGVPWADWLPAVIWDLLVAGNAYADRGRSPAPQGLAWLPESNLIATGAAGYRSTSGVSYVDRQVVHWRMRRDPSSPRTGVSPLTSVLSELAVDSQAAAFALWALRNRGTPWLMFTPDKEVGRSPNAESRQALEAELTGLTTGSRQGRAVVIPVPGQVHFPNSTLGGLVTSALRAVPEERLTAIYHVPASVVGLGTGLEQTKVGATLSEARKAAYKDGVIPVMHKIIRSLELSLGIKLAVDLSNVEELQDDLTAVSTRISAQVTSGIRTVASAQEELGIEVDDRAHVYYVGGIIIREGELDLQDDISLPTAVEDPDADGDEEVAEGD